MQVCKGLLTSRRLAKLGEGGAELKVDEFINQLFKYKPVDEESEKAISDFTKSLPHMQPKDTEEAGKEEKVLHVISVLFVVMVDNIFSELHMAIIQVTKAVLCGQDKKKSAKGKKGK